MSNNPIKLNPSGAFDFVITTAQDASPVLRFEPVLPIAFIGLTVKDRATKEEKINISYPANGIDPIQQFPGEYVLNFAHGITDINPDIYDVDIWVVLTDGTQYPISLPGGFKVNRRITVVPGTLPKVYITTILGNPITVTVNGTEGLLTN